MKKIFDVLLNVFIAFNICLIVKMLVKIISILQGEI